MPHKPFKYSRAVFRKAVSIWNKAKNEWLSREPHLSERPAACNRRPHINFPSAVPALLRLPRRKTAGATPVWRTNVNAEVSSEDLRTAPEAEPLEHTDHTYVDKAVQTNDNPSSPPQAFTEQPPAKLFGHVSTSCEGLNHVERFLPTPDYTLDTEPSPRRHGLDLQPQTADHPHASRSLSSRVPSSSATRRLSSDSQLSGQSCLETPTSSFHAGGWYQYAFGNISRRSFDGRSPDELILDERSPDVSRHQQEGYRRNAGDGDDSNDSCADDNIDGSDKNGLSPSPRVCSPLIFAICSSSITGS
ncbi:hypothetical protein BC629DRAFT_1589532 [Irpex lacteus]|nr:hypothetical protein BC629DRAFT_1589532 [Irpex lacteus]